MTMKPFRIYADTSIFGGLHDEEFADTTRLLFDHIDGGRLFLVTSAVVQAELAQAPERVRREFEERLPFMEIVNITEESISLQDAYLAEGIVSVRWASDALHVALATIAACELIVSWNFKHIVNFQRIRLYNEVNRRMGRQEIAIHAPPEVIYDDEEKEL